MSHLIDILSCIMECIFQLKPPFSVIAQEINRVTGGLVLKPKLLYVEIGNNTHMRTSTTYLESKLLALLWPCALSSLVNIYKRKLFYSY